MARLDQFQQRGAFADRQEAGTVLADRLTQFAGRGDVMVLALPRGGVPVGYEVARALGARLDVFVVRKLGLPGHPELAMGAIASGDIRVLNEDVLESYPVPQAAIGRHHLPHRASGDRSSPTRLSSPPSSTR